jgi:hypothetical protein
VLTKERAETKEPPSPANTPRTNSLSCPQSARFEIVKLWFANVMLLRVIKGPEGNIQLPKEDALPHLLWRIKLRLAPGLVPPLTESVSNASLQGHTPPTVSVTDGKITDGPNLAASVQGKGELP